MHINHLTKQVIQDNLSKIRNKSRMMIINILKISKLKDFPASQSKVLIAKIQLKFRKISKKCRPVD